MRRALQILLIASVSILSGCVSIVLDNTDTATYQQLAEWKNRVSSTKPTSAENYQKAKIAVNAWIDAKQTEVTIAGGDLFTKVDLTIDPKVSSFVSQAYPAAFRPSGKVDIGELVKAIIDALLGAAQKQRTDSAMKINAALGAYKWPDAPPM